MHARQGPTPASSRCKQSGSRAQVRAGLSHKRPPYLTGSGHPYPYPLELSFTRRVTRTRVGKWFHTRTQRVIYTGRVTRTRKHTRELHINITYSYEK